MSKLEDFEDLPYEDELRYTERQLNEKIRGVIDVCNKKQNDTYRENQELKEDNRNLKIAIKSLINLIKEDKQ